MNKENAVEPTLRPGSDTSNQSTTTFERPKQKHPSAKKVVKVIKKLWYVFVVLGVVLGVAIGWWVSSANTDAAWKRAEDAFSRADYETAKKEIGAMPVPSDEDRLKVYAQTMLATRTLDKALVGYTKLYEITKDPQTYLLLGNVYNQQENYDKAVQIYTEVTKSNPQLIQAYVNLATVYKLQSKMDDAISTANKAVENNPKSVQAYELLVALLVENDRDTEEFTTAVEALKALNPEDPLLDAINE